MRVPSPAEPDAVLLTTVSLRTGSSIQATSSKGGGEPESGVSQPPTFSALGLNFFQFSGSRNDSGPCCHIASMEAGRVFVAGQRADRKARCVIERATEWTEHLLCMLPTQPIDRTIVYHEEGQSHFGRVPEWEERSVLAENWKFALRWAFRAVGEG